MDAKVRDKALERARSLEKGGQGDAAAKLFREAGAVEEAARVLGALRRPRDAAQLLLDSLGVPPGQAGRLDPAGKKRALMAAIFLGRSGENQMAVQVFMALGEQQRAVELLQKAGDDPERARLPLRAFRRRLRAQRSTRRGGAAGLRSAGSAVRDARVSGERARGVAKDPGGAAFVPGRARAARSARPAAAAYGDDGPPGALERRPAQEADLVAARSGRAARCGGFAGGRLGNHGPQ